MPQVSKISTNVNLSLVVALTSSNNLRYGFYARSMQNAATRTQDTTNTEQIEVASRMAPRTSPPFPSLPISNSVILSFKFPVRLTHSRRHLAGSSWLEWGLTRGEYRSRWWRHDPPPLHLLRTVGAWVCVPRASNCSLVAGVDVAASICW